jgi:hypothetical protein
MMNDGGAEDTEKTKTQIDPQIWQIVQIWFL